MQFRPDPRLRSSDFFKVLRGRRHVTFQREMADELSDFFRTHFCRVSRVVEKDEPLDPADVRVFGAGAVVLDANGFADLVQEPGLGGVALPAKCGASSG